VSRVIYSAILITFMFNYLSIVQEEIARWSINMFGSVVPAITAITSMLAVTSRTVIITSSTSLLAAEEINSSGI